MKKYFESKRANTLKNLQVPYLYMEWIKAQFNLCAFVL